MKTVSLQIRNVTLNDGAGVWELIRRCPPLDVNSSYSYLLLCRHFAETCLVAERGADILGFVSAYHTPQDAKNLFVWQIAVDETARGQGLAKKMLLELLRRRMPAGVKWITTSITPSNAASRRLFESLAEDLGVECRREKFFPSEVFPPDFPHEEEELFKLGPIQRS